MATPSCRAAGAATCPFPPCRPVTTMLAVRRVGPPCMNSRPSKSGRTCTHGATRSGFLERRRGRAGEGVGALLIVPHDTRALGEKDCLPTRRPALWGLQRACRCSRGSTSEGGCMDFRRNIAHRAVGGSSGLGTWVEEARSLRLFLVLSALVHLGGFAVWLPPQWPAQPGLGPDGHRYTLIVRPPSASAEDAAVGQRADSRRPQPVQVAAAGGTERPPRSVDPRAAMRPLPGAPSKAPRTARVRSPKRSAVKGQHGESSPLERKPPVVKPDRESRDVARAASGPRPAPREGAPGLVRAGRGGGQSAKATQFPGGSPSMGGAHTESRGGGLTTTPSRRSSPRYRGGGLNNPLPPYPLIARIKGWQGRVLLDVVVSAQGRPHTVTVERSSGHRVLDLAALKAVRSWRFIAAQRDGRNVFGQLTVPVVFRLE